MVNESYNKIPHMHLSCRRIRILLRSRVAVILAAFHLAEALLQTSVFFAWHARDVVADPSPVVPEPGGVVFCHPVYMNTTICRRDRGTLYGPG